MRWVEPEYSKKAVKRAGEKLISPAVTDEEYSNSMDILSNWRSAHAYPMHAMLISLRRMSSKIDSKAVVVQRLKRTPSILSKLKRYNKMKLHRMQDIGGCRTVVSTSAKAEKLYDRIVNSRTRHRLHKIDDYIKEPKESGYRGIHLVYKYNGDKQVYKDYFIELQLRSKIQHAWATAIEIVDHFTSQALKASHGQKDWLDFFKMSSAEFATLEKRPRGVYYNDIDTKNELSRLEQVVNATGRLNAFTVSTEFIERVKVRLFFIGVTRKCRRNID